MTSAWLGVSAYLLVAGAALAAILARLLIPLARRWGVLDVPKPGALHAAPVPLLGGAAVAAAMTLLVWGHLAAAQLVLESPGLLDLVPANLRRNLPGLGGTWMRLAVIFAGGICFFAIGLWDDVRGVSVRKRIYPEFLVAILVVGLGIHAELAFLPKPLAMAVSVVWLVGIANSFNLIDGADGLAAGLAAVAALCLGAILLATGHPAGAAFNFALAGCALGFLALNWHPARIFLGSSGSLFLGYMLGVSTLVAAFGAGAENWLFPMLIPVLVFAVPLYDTASVVGIRLLGGRSIFQGDRSHFHHRLMRIGFSVRQTVAFSLFLAAAFGLAAFLISRGSFWPNVAILGQVIALVGLVALMERVVLGRARRESGAPRDPSDPDVQVEVRHPDPVRIPLERVG